MARMFRTRLAPRDRHRAWQRTTIGAALIGLFAAGLAAAPSAVAQDDLALGKPASASSHTQGYVAGNATDGNQASYWESTNGNLPQWLEVDLGADVPIDEIVLALPVSGWPERTQTIEISARADGEPYQTVVASASYLFDPDSGSTATATFGETTARYVQLEFFANSEWPAGQLSSFEVHGPAGDPGDPGGDGDELAGGRAVSASSHVPSTCRQRG